MADDKCSEKRPVGAQMCRFRSEVRECCPVASRSEGRRTWKWAETSVFKAEGLEVPSYVWGAGELQ